MLPRIIAQRLAGETFRHVETGRSLVGRLPKDQTEGSDRGSKAEILERGVDGLRLALEFLADQLARLLLRMLVAHLHCQPFAILRGLRRLPARLILQRIDAGNVD